MSELASAAELFETTCIQQGRGGQLYCLLSDDSGSNPANVYIFSIKNSTRWDPTTYLVQNAYGTNLFNIVANH